MNPGKPKRVKEQRIGLMSRISEIQHAVPNNIVTRTGKVDMGFSVDRAMRRRYKQAALSADMTMIQIFEESFEDWLRKKGLDI